MFAINNLVTAAKFFTIITAELILIFVAVAFIIGVLMEYLPPSRVRTFLSNKLTWVQYMLGSGLGAVTPFCSCSTVPITAGLLKSGVPFGPTMAFLFSSPVLNPVIIALLLSLFGLKITVIYAAVTFLGSMVLAAILSRMGMERQVKPFMAFQTPSCCGEDVRSQQRRLRRRRPRQVVAHSFQASPCHIHDHTTGGRLLLSRTGRPRQPAAQSSCCSDDVDVDTDVKDVPLEKR
jgi:uncharacterized membrane protein YraQ (UPF0718 family)